MRQSLESARSENNVLFSHPALASYSVFMIPFIVSIRGLVGPRRLGVLRVSQKLGNDSVQMR